MERALPLQRPEIGSIIPHYDDAHVTIATKLSRTVAVAAVMTISGAPIRQSGQRHDISPRHAMTEWSRVTSGVTIWVYCGRPVPSSLLRRLIYGATLLHQSDVQCGWIFTNSVLLDVLSSDQESK